MGKCSQQCSGTGFKESLGWASRGRALAPQAPRLSSVHSDPQVRWMMYWIVFAIFMAAETFTDIFISWFGTRIDRPRVGKAHPLPGIWLTKSPPIAYTGSRFIMRSRWLSCCGCSHLTPKEPACSTESLSTHPYPAMRRYPWGRQSRNRGCVREVCQRESPVSQVQGAGGGRVLFPVPLWFCCGTVMGLAFSIHLDDTYG